MMESIKTGDRVVFGGGIMGIVANVKEKTYVVKIADNVKVEVTRGAVTQVLEKGEQPETEQKS
jgi:preprotein translocase subunit YajC